LRLLLLFERFAFIKRYHQQDKRHPYYNKTNEDDRKKRSNEEHSTGSMEEFYPCFSGERIHCFLEIEGCKNRKCKEDDKSKYDCSNEWEDVTNINRILPVDGLPGTEISEVVDSQ